jgi:hypothetical protein
MKTSNQIPACGYVRVSTAAQWEKECGTLLTTLTSLFVERGT